MIVEKHENIDCTSDAYLGPFQISRIELSSENDKHSVIDVWLDSKYFSVEC